MKNKKTQSGSATIIILVLIIVLGVMSYVGSTLNKSKNTSTSSKPATKSLRSQQIDYDRKSGLGFLRLNINLFYDDYGYYPSRSDMNDPNFIKTKMTGTTQNVLKDKSCLGSQPILVAEATKCKYAYQPTDIDGNSCETNDLACKKYTLTTILSDGKVLQYQNK